jgi:hypothetical protein
MMASEAEPLDKIANARPDNINPIAALAFMLTMPGKTLFSDMESSFQPSNTTTPSPATIKPSRNAFRRAARLWLGAFMADSPRILPQVRNCLNLFDPTLQPFPFAGLARKQLLILRSPWLPSPFILRSKAALEH